MVQLMNSRTAMVAPDIQYSLSVIGLCQNILKRISEKTYGIITVSCSIFAFKNVSCITRLSVGVLEELSSLICKLECLYLCFAS